MRVTRRERGVVLLTVMVFIVIAIAGIATFLRRATVDGLIAANRDHAARSEALARGGVQLGIALLLQDRLSELETIEAETRDDIWARAGAVELQLPDGGSLRVHIEDAGARLNLNALFADGTVRADVAEILLEELIDKVTTELAVSDDRKNYDAFELAQNLIDYVDEDEVNTSGGLEDDAYQKRTPAARTANGPLLSVEELARVEGFDAQLVEALRPYVTVYPIYGGQGVNPNTAPPWVLALLFHGPPGDQRLADADTVRRIVEAREGGSLWCDETADRPECTPLLEVVDGEIFPPPTWTASVFRIVAEARYGEVRRAVEAVVDRDAEPASRLLAWRVD